MGTTSGRTQQHLENKRLPVRLPVVTPQAVTPNRCATDLVELDQAHEYISICKCSVTKSIRIPEAAT